ncbi:MAG: MBL fold metallo-hydrolase [Candidatus Riflebacteria bacterium]|nr:MBL fold metallo-hydrolase [Candidatus Riflebacteria bacterium]
MKLKFWGTRGSIPTPQPDRMKYGGDTPCVELRSSRGDVIILDAGTGIRRLGQELMKNKPDNREITILLSHTHWDHIQGFPFFIPIYDRSFRFKIIGPLRMNSKMEMRLQVQMSDLFFPVNLSALEETMQFIEIVEDPFLAGSVKIAPRNLCHPLGCFGYRITEGNTSVVYATDTEHTPGVISEDLAYLGRDADLLIYDAHFTDSEFPKFVGWGHSTWQEGVRLCKALNIKKLILFHHDPNHDDAFLDQVVEEAQEQFPNTIPACRDLELEI